MWGGEREVEEQKGVGKGRQLGSHLVLHSLAARAGRSRGDWTVLRMNDNGGGMGGCW